MKSCGQKGELVKRGNYIKGFSSKVLTEMRGPCSFCINGWIRIPPQRHHILWSAGQNHIHTFGEQDDDMDDAHDVHCANNEKDGEDDNMIDDRDDDKRSENECSDDPDMGMGCTLLLHPCKKSPPPENCQKFHFPLCTRLHCSTSNSKCLPVSLHN